MDKIMNNTFPMPPHRWLVGDLGQQKYYGKFLVIGVVAGVYNSYDIINEHSQQFQLDIPEGYIGKTGLSYDFTDFYQVQADFKKGLFTPYFTIETTIPT